MQVKEKSLLFDSHLKELAGLECFFMISEFSILHLSCVEMEH